MLREKISVQEMEMIDYYRRDYAYNGEYTHGKRASAYEILRYWAREKGDLYQLLGNQLIYSKEICIKAPYFMLENEMEHLLDRSDFYLWYRDLGWKLFEDDYDSRNAFFSILNRDWLTENRVKGETYKFKFPKDDKVISAPHNSKPMKFLAKVAELYGATEKFEEFRLAHSRILNKKELHGELCLSIHPLDYMTMSDNASGWSSCMSWQESGCYRRGTVEMMNSDCVLVAYLRAKEDMRISGGYWNNKKWRQLFVVNENFASAIKAYPYASEDLTRECLLAIQELAAKNLNREYSTDVIDYSHCSTFYLSEEDADEGENGYYISFETDVMYNDFDNMSGTHIILAKDLAPGRYYCNYSGIANCMHCGGAGEDYGSFDECEGNLICDECCPTYYCAECGERIYDLDCMYEVDGCHLCEYCYENRTVETKDDEETHLEGNVCRIHLVGTKDGLHHSNRTISVYDPDNTDFIEEYFNISKFHRDTEYWGSRYVLIDECKPEGLELFDFYLGDEDGLAELEEYKTAYSLCTSDRYERERRLRAGLSWPLTQEELEAEEARSRAISSSLARWLIDDFMEKGFVATTSYSLDTGNDDDDLFSTFELTW